MALRREVLRYNHDFLVRAHARDVIAPKGLRSVNRELSRLCPCPVWAVGPTAAAAPKRILAAVRATDDSFDVDRNTIETALRLAHVYRATAVVLNACTAFGESVLRKRSTPEDFAAHVNAAEKAAQEGVRALINSFDGPLDQIGVGLKKGPVEDVILSFVVSEGIDVIVAGGMVRQAARD